MKLRAVIQPLLAIVLFIQSVAPFALANESENYRQISKRDLLTWSLPQVSLSQSERALKPISGDHALYSMVGLTEEQGMTKKTADLEKMFHKQDLKFLDENTRLSKTVTIDTINSKNIDALARDTRAARQTVVMAAADYPGLAKLNIENQIYENSAARAFKAAKAAGLDYKDLKPEHPIRRTALILATISAIDGLKTTPGYSALYQRMLDIRALTLANFKNPEWRMKYDVNSGQKMKISTKLAWWNPSVRNAVKEGVVFIKMKDPKTGKFITKPLTVVSRDDYRSSPATAIEKIKGGARVVQNMTLGSLSYILVLGLAAHGKLLLAGNSTPAALEQAVSTYGNMAFAGSILGFNLSNIAVDKAYYPRLVNLQRLQALQTKDPITGLRMLEGNPMRTAVLRDTVMQLSLSKNALGIGVSTAIGILGQKASACNDLMDDVPMTNAVRLQKKTDCDRGYIEYLQSAAPQTIMQLLIYAGIQKTFFFFGHLKWIKESKNPENFVTYQNTKVENIADDLAKSPEGRTLSASTVIPDELASINSASNNSKVFSLVRGIKGFFNMTIQTAIFFVVMDVSQRVLAWGIPTVTTAVKLTQNKINFDKHFENLKREGFSEAAYCAGGGSRSDTEDTCRAPIVDSLSKYAVTRDEWRNVVTSGLQTRLNQWSAYFQKAINTAKAGRVFYSDVTSQIAVAKKQNKKITPMLDNKGQLKAEHYVKYAFEELPLFRTQPLFGVRPELMDKSWLVAGKNPEEKVTFSWINMTDKQKQISKSEIETNLVQKSATVSEGGRWLKAQASALTGNESLKKDLLTIAGLMDSQRKTLQEKLIDQTQSLITLQQKSNQYSSILEYCGTGKFDKAGLCLYSQAHSRLGDVFLEAATFLRERLKKNLIAPNHKSSSQDLLSQLSSLETVDRRAGVELLLRLVKYSGVNTSEICIDKQLKSKNIPGDCTLQAMLAMIDANNSEDDYLPERLIYGDVTRLTKLAPFNYRLNADSGGFKQLDNKTPTGPYPLSWGHKYLMNYFVTLKDYGVETDLYPESISSLPTTSMSQFLMMSTMCGPQSLDREGGVVILKDGYSPKFYPPRLKMVQNLNFCSQINDAQFSQNAYHQIRSVNQSRTWYGFADLLYHNVSSEVLNKNFMPWWKKAAELPLENVIVKDAQVAYLGHKIAGVKTSYGIPDLARIMLYGDGGALVKFSQEVDRSLGMPRNLLEVVKEEFNYYFNTVLKPVYESKNTSWYTPSLKVWKYSNGLPSVLLKDYENDQTFKKSHLEQLRTEFLGHLQMYLVNAVDDPNLSEQHFFGLVKTLFKLKSLFYTLNEKERPIFNELIAEQRNTSKDGKFTVYPSLSYKGHPRFTKADEQPVVQLVTDTLSQMEQAIYNMMPIVGSAAKTKNILEELKKY